MNQNDISTVWFYVWVIITGVLGALNLRATYSSMKLKNKLAEEIKAKDTKIIMLEAKVIYLETQLSHDNSISGNSK